MTNLSKMNDVFNKLSDEPFKYGKADCYTFTAKLVKEWHGKDYLKLHSVYKNKKEAEKYMFMNGGIEALTTGTLGYSISPERCIDGDVVSAFVSSDQIALGFVFNGNAYFKTKKKPVKLPLKKCRKGWSIK